MFFLSSEAHYVLYTSSVLNMLFMEKYSLNQNFQLMELYCKGNNLSQIPSTDDGNKEHF